MTVCRRPDLVLTYSPRYYKLAQKKESSLRLPITVLAIMVAHWDVLATATMLLLTLASLLLATRMIWHGLVALYYNWTVLLGLS